MKVSYRVGFHALWAQELPNVSCLHPSPFWPQETLFLGVKGPAWTNSRTGWPAAVGRKGNHLLMHLPCLCSKKLMHSNCFKFFKLFLQKKSGRGIMPSATQSLNARVLTKLVSPWEQCGTAGKRMRSPWFKSQHSNDFIRCCWANRYPNQLEHSKSKV